jgi:hypothetical protein
MSKEKRKDWQSDGAQAAKKVKTASEGKKAGGGGEDKKEEEKKKELKETHLIIHIALPEPLPESSTTESSDLASPQQRAILKLLSESSEKTLDMVAAKKTWGFKYSEVLLKKVYVQGGSSDTYRSSIPHKKLGKPKVSLSADPHVLLPEFQRKQEKESIIGALVEQYKQIKSAHGLKEKHLTMMIKTLLAVCTTAGDIRFAFHGKGLVAHFGQFRGVSRRRRGSFSMPAALTEHWEKLMKSFAKLFKEHSHVAYLRHIEKKRQKTTPAISINPDVFKEFNSVLLEKIERGKLLDPQDIMVTLAYQSGSRSAELCRNKVNFSILSLQRDSYLGDNLNAAIVHFGHGVREQFLKEVATMEGSLVRDWDILLMSLKQLAKVALTAYPTREIFHNMASKLKQLRPRYEKLMKKLKPFALVHSLVGTSIMCHQVAKTRGMSEYKNWLKMLNGFNSLQFMEVYILLLCRLNFSEEGYLHNVRRRASELTNTLFRRGSVKNETRGDRHTFSDLRSFYATEMYDGRSWNLNKERGFGFLLGHQSSKLQSASAFYTPNFSVEPSGPSKVKEISQQLRECEDRLKWGISEVLIRKFMPQLEELHARIAELEERVKNSTGLPRAKPAVARAARKKAFEKCIEEEERRAKDGKSDFYEQNTLGDRDRFLYDLIKEAFQGANCSHSATTIRALFKQLKWVHRRAISKNPSDDEETDDEESQEVVFQFCTLKDYLSNFDEAYGSMGSTR